MNFASDMAAGLLCVHQHGMIHGDVACRNFLVMHTGRVKLTDFGMASHQDEPAAMSTLKSLPLCWMAPEIIDTMVSGQGNFTSSRSWVADSLSVSSSMFRPPPPKVTCTRSELQFGRCFRSELGPMAPQPLKWLKP